MSKCRIWGVSALVIGAFATWLTPNIDYVLIALGVLVVLDILFNIGDEQQEFKAVARLMLAAILPLGLKFIGSNGHYSQQYFLLGIAIAFGVLLNRVVPKLITYIGVLVGQIFPNNAQATAIDQTLVSALQSEVAKLQAELNTAVKAGTPNITSTVLDTTKTPVQGDEVPLK